MGHARQRFVKRHHAVRQQCTVEGEVFFARGTGFEHKQVHWIKAIGDAPVGGWRLKPNQTSFPALRQMRRFGPHALRVVAVVVVEERQLADVAVDQIGEFGCLQWLDVCRHRQHAFRWRLVDGADDGLAANDHELVLVRDLGRRPNQVFEL